MYLATAATSSPPVFAASNSRWNSSRPALTMSLCDSSPFLIKASTAFENELPGETKLAAAWTPPAAAFATLITVSFKTAAMFLVFGSSFLDSSLTAISFSANKSRGVVRDFSISAKRSRAIIKSLIFSVLHLRRCYIFLPYKQCLRH